jgi:hypothetical protein
MEIDCLQRNNTFKFKITFYRHNAKLQLNNCALLDPPHFLLPSTFKVKNDMWPYKHISALLGTKFLYIIFTYSYCIELSYPSEL